MIKDLTVIKRDGRKKIFNMSYIKEAVHKAYLDVRDEDCFKNNYIFLEPMIEKDIENLGVDKIDVERIQDLVIESLKKVDKVVAKSYEDYRNERSRRRRTETEKKILELIKGENEFLAKENANKDSKLVSTQRDLMAGTLSRVMGVKYMLPKKLIEAQDEGLIKMHDQDYIINDLTNCCLIPLKDMFEKGTVVSDTMIEEPKSLSTACTVATQIVAGVASGQFGGCTFSLSHLSKYVRVSKNKIRKQLEKYLSGKELDKLVDEMLNKEIKDSIQTINYQINTLNSTNGQHPFVTIFIDLDEYPEYHDETKMLARELLIQRIKGIKNKDGHYVTQVFPKILFTLRDTNIGKDSRDYDLLDLAMRSTAKRQAPDYISAKKMKELYGSVFPCINKACA